MFLTKWYHRHEHNLHSLFRCEEYDANNFLPLVHLVGSVPQHFLIAQKQCSLTNSTRYRMDRQKVPSRFLRGRRFEIARYPQGRRFIWPDRPHPHYYLNGMATQPTAVRISGSEICSGTYQFSGEREI